MRSVSAAPEESVQEEEVPSADKKSDLFAELNQGEEEGDVVQCEEDDLDEEVERWIKKHLRKEARREKIRAKKRGEERRKAEKKEIKRKRQEKRALKEATCTKQENIDEEIEVL